MQKLPDKIRRKRLHIGSLPISIIIAAILLTGLLSGCAASDLFTRDTISGVMADLKTGVESRVAAQVESSETEENQAEKPTNAELVENIGKETDNESASRDDTAPEESAPEQTPPPAPRTITLMAVGDNLLHLPIIQTGLQPDGNYNFDFLFDGIKPQLETADIKIINQETILGGDEHGPSGYPNFNSPTAIGDAIAGAGFNVVLQASNHSADMGIKGINHCVSFWETHPEVLMTGIRTREAADAVQNNADEFPIPTITIEDVTFAVLNYTYSPNLETLPKSIRGPLNMLCNWNTATGRIDFTTLHPQVLRDIERADEIADVVIVCPHWGTEYTTKPSTYQRQFAEQMTQAGADLIIGTHPHVIQPVEWVISENGNRALCYYSLGNYLSTQRRALCMLEGMAWVTFREVEGKMVVSANRSGVIPMVCHYTANPVRMDRVYFLEDYTPELAQSHGIWDYGGVELHLSDLQKWSEEVFGTWNYSTEKALRE